MLLDLSQNLTDMMSGAACLYALYVFIYIYIYILILALSISKVMRREFIF